MNHPTEIQKSPFRGQSGCFRDLATTFESLSIGLNEEGFEPLDRGKESFRRFTAQTCCVQLGKERRRQ
jgi:hypothetical protein